MEIEDNSIKRKRNTIIWIIVLVVVILALTGLLYWQMKNLNAAKKATASVTATTTATVSQTPTKTATETVSQTSTLTSDDQTPQVRTAAEGFLNAYVRRNLEEAKPYMTAVYFATWTQEGFAGVSSPGRVDFKIVDIATVADRWEVEAQVNLQLNGEEVGHESWQVDVFFEDGKYLVGDMKAVSI